MSDPGCWPGPITGVSGGGGEPRWARVVEVDALELMRLMALFGGCRFRVFDAAAAEGGLGAGEGWGGG